MARRQPVGRYVKGPEVPWHGRALRGHRWRELQAQLGYAELLVAICEMQPCSIAPAFPDEAEFQRLHLAQAHLFESVRFFAVPRSMLWE